MRINEILRDLNDKTSLKNIILDSDTFNEVDDQFALAYAILSEKNINLLSVTAAPFLNKKVASAEEGMLKSYEEIKNVIKRMSLNRDIPAFRGADRFLTDNLTPVPSDACRNIIESARQTADSGKTLYIVAIGAITNVASAILTDPGIIEKAAVIWLGGVGFAAPFYPEFNLKQDIRAAQVVFDSGIPLMIIPTFGVSSELITTVHEMDHYIAGKNDICSYLADILREYSENKFAWSKVLWDIANIGCICVPEAFDKVLSPTPMISPEGRYIFDASRHQCIYTRQIKRDPVFRDMIKKITSI